MKITLLPGDGIGVEIVDAAVEVLDAAAKKYNFTVEYDKKLIGGAAIDAFGTPLPGRNTGKRQSKRRSASGRGRRPEMG